MNYVNYDGKKYLIKGKTLTLRNKGIKDITQIIGLGKTVQLSKLDLANNNIIEIKGLESLENLEVLNLSRNCISKIKGLEKLTNLKELYLFENQIIRIEGLESLNRLEVLSFSENKISDINGLDHLVNLKKISLFNNHITEIKGLKSLSSLRELNLIRNSITEMEGLKDLNNLKVLFLDQNEIVEIKNLEMLTELEKLGLFRNQLKEIKGLEKNINLKNLYLSQNAIQEIKGLDTLVNLKLLNLSKNQISDIKGLNNLRNLRELHLYGNNITEIKGLEDNVNLEYLSLERNNITRGKEFIKLLDNKNIRFLEFDYDKIEFLDSNDQILLLKFLKKNYEIFFKKYIELKDKFPRLLNSPSYKFRNFKEKVKKLLNRLIGLINILINLHQEEWKKEMLFHNELKVLINDRLNLEEKDSKEYYKLNALKNVFFAGMENTYKEQIRFLKDAIKNFNKAGEFKCEFFYLIHISLIQSLIAHSEGNIEACRKDIDKILDLYQKYSNEKFNPSLEILINELPNIQKKLIDYTCEPEHLKRLIYESSKRCNEIIKEACPQLQFYKPGVYRILSHIINNMRESWQNTKLSKESYNLWYSKMKRDTRKLWKNLYRFLRRIDLKFFSFDTFDNENIFNQKIYDLLTKEFLDIDIHTILSGKIHVDLTESIIAIEIKKLESNTAKDELIGQIIEDLRIGIYKYGIIFGIDISKNKELTRYNDLFFGNGKIYCIIKPFPY
ncbi:MAG: leucine-rich repeat domain-containing protein [Promethearchaeota archaeon]